VAALKAGDTLCLSDGTYAEPFVARTNGTQAAPIMPAALGADAVALGAVAMVLQNILQGPAIEVGGPHQLADLRRNNLGDPAVCQPADCLVVNAS